MVFETRGKEIWTINPLALVVDVHRSVRTPYIQMNACSEAGFLSCLAFSDLHPNFREQVRAWYKQPNTARSIPY